MKSRLKLYNRLRASYKFVFICKDLNRIGFATSLDQCKGRYTGHESSVVQVSNFRKLLFIIFGR